MLRKKIHLLLMRLDARLLSNPSRFYQWTHASITWLDLLLYRYELYVPTKKGLVISTPFLSEEIIGLPELPTKQEIKLLRYDRLKQVWQGFMPCSVEQRAQKKASFLAVVMGWDWFDLSDDLQTYLSGTPATV